MKNITPVFTGPQRKGKIKLPRSTRTNLNKWIASFPEETLLDISISKHKNINTISQKGYYFSTVVPLLMDHFGYDNKKDMHNALKLEHNPIENKLRPGTMIGGSIKNMSTEEFFSNETSFVNRVCRWAAMEYGILIPEPEKVKSKRKVK